MSHVVRTRLDTSTAPSDATDRVATIKDQFRPILPDSHREYRTVEDIDGTELYDEFLLRFDIRDDVDAIVSAVVEEFDADVDWLLVETRQDDREWEVAEYRDNPSYYEPGKTDGHRTPPALDRAGLFDVDAADAEYLIDGTEYSAPGRTTVPEPPAETPRTDTVVATADGAIERLVDKAPSEVASDVVVVGELEVHPGKVVVISVADVDVTTTDWTTAHESGSVPTEAQ